MSLREVGTVRDTTEITLYNPKTRATLYNADGSPMTVTVYGPYSEEYRKVQHDLSNRRLKRAQRGGSGMTITAEEASEAAEELLARIVAGWNLTVDTKPEPFTAESVRAVFKEFPWVKEQVDAVLGDTSDFLEPSSKT